MAEIIKPTEVPKWASTGVITPAPSNSVQESGWTGPPQKPPYQWFNWFQNLVYRWILYFENKFDVALGSSAATTLGIVSGSVTPTLGQHLVDTEGLAASDDLTNIVVTNLNDGRLLAIQCVDAARIVTLKHAFGGSGQMILAHGVDVYLDSPRKIIVFKRRGTNWEEISRSVPLFEDKVTHNGNITLPFVTGLDFGSTSFRWNIFVGTLDVTNLISNFVPNTNATRNLGADAFAFQSLISQRIDTGTTGTTINIGDINATIINIGRTGQTVNIFGAVNNITTTNTNVTDKLVTFNDGGIAASGGDSGFEIEENAIGTGYVKTSADRNSWRIKAPGNANEFLMTPASGNTIIGMLPLGSILAIMPHLVGAYSCAATTAADGNGFVLCDGQTIIDATSPMNGAVIPNINDNVFLMGTAGSTSGSAVGTNTRDFSHTHSVTLSSANLPVHSHSIDHTHGSFTTGSQSADHSHTFTGVTTQMSANSVHTHTGSTDPSTQQSQPAGVLAGTGAAYGQTQSAPHSHTFTTNGTNIDHSHNYGGTTSGMNVSHTHNVTISAFSGSSGNGPGSASAATTTSGLGTIDIRPKYISAKYIMRIK